MRSEMSSLAAVTALLDQGRAAQRAGQTQQAAQVYRRIVETDPSHVGAWHSLGQALQTLGEHAEAVAAYQSALRLRAGSVDVVFNLATAFADLGRRGEAEATYRQVLELAPRHAEAHINLAVIRAEQGDVGQAVELLRHAVRLRPDIARAHQNLGVAHCQLGQFDEAERCLREALRLQPGYADAWYNLGSVLGNLGRPEESIASYRCALEQRPEHHGACNNLGLALSQSRPGEALVLLQHAIRLRPGAVESHNNLGLAFAALGRFAEAEAAYHEALRLDPRHVEAHNNLGNACKEQGRFEEAFACYGLALALNPESASTQHNRALALLQSGDYEQGWAAYEWRWRRKNQKGRSFRQPRWQGQPLEGKSILLWCEQGLGDTIQFIRCARLVKERGGRVLVECPGCLVPLLSSCAGIDQFVAEGAALPEFDVQCPLMSLPGVLGTTLSTVPGEVPYLHAEAERLRHWQARLKALSCFKFGVVWQGNPQFQWDRFRSIPLRALAPLAEVPGVRLINLQKGPGKEQLRGNGFAVTELVDELDENGGAFLDTAAIMTGLDLVVTSDTATAHLAGALGVPVWVALSAVADWRWLRDRDDTPWYPSMRLFRQTELGAWGPVFTRMAEQLQCLAAAGDRDSLIQIEVSPGELLDRLTILQIKSERIAVVEKRARALAELAQLQRIREQRLPILEELARLEAELKHVNLAIWEVEDEVRLCERNEDFGERFVALARSVYRNNDKRAALKKQVNALLGSPLDEQKSHPAYG